MSEAYPLIRISPEDMRSVWLGIVGRIAKLSETERWDAMDVGRALISGSAQLWVTPSLSGFIVVCVVNEAWGKSLFVWIACNAIIGSLRGYLPQVREIARRNGCAVFEFETDREGYKRALPEAEVRYIYRMGV